MELKSVKAGSFGDAEASKYPENSRTYINTNTPFRFPLVTFGRNPLTPGKYKVEITCKAVNGEEGCKLYLTSKNSRDALPVTPGKTASGLQVMSCNIEVKDAQMNYIEIDPGNGSKLFTNLVITPR